MKNELELLNNFKLLTKKNFTFLSTTYDFICTREEDKGTRYSEIVYENSKLKIKINFDAYSFEIGFYLSEAEANENLFSIGDLIGFYGVEKEIGFLAPQANTPERIEIAVSAIAEFLKKYATSLLKADKKEFQKIVAFRKKITDGS